MLTVIIPTRESERPLVQTLAPLVAGATAGLIAEVIVADAGSKDATADVADLAGCRYVATDGATGARLAGAAKEARAPWLLFLRPGTVPEPGWIETVESFIGSDRETAQAGIFRPPAPRPRSRCTPRRRRRVRCPVFERPRQRPRARTPAGLP